MIPDDGDDIKEEIIDFDSESNEKPVDLESEEPSLAPPPPLKVKQSTSPTVPGPHHVPGVPVPHTYKENRVDGKCIREDGKSLGDRACASNNEIRRNG